MSNEHQSAQRASACVIDSDSNKLDGTAITRARDLVAKGKAIIVCENPLTIQLTYEYEMGKAARKVIEKGALSNPKLKAVSLSARGAYCELLEYMWSNKLYYKVPDDSRFLSTILNISLEESIAVRTELIDAELVIINAANLICTEVIEVRRNYYRKENNTQAVRVPVAAAKKQSRLGDYKQESDKHYVKKGGEV